VDCCWSVGTFEGAVVPEFVDWFKFSPMTWTSQVTPCTAVCPNACMNASSLGSTPSSPSSSPSSSSPDSVLLLDCSSGTSTTLYYTNKTGKKRKNMEKTLTQH